MKKIYLLFVGLVFMSVSLVSCGSDDNGGSSSIVGKWEGYKTAYYVDGELISEDDWEHLCSSKKDYIDLKANGTFSEVSYDESCVEEIETGNYSVSGNNLSIDYGGEDTFTGKIVALESSKLIVESESETGGMTIKVRVEFRK